MNNLYIFFKTCFLGFMKNLVVIIRLGVSNQEDIYWVSKTNLLNICVKKKINSICINSFGLHKLFVNI